MAATNPSVMDPRYKVSLSFASTTGITSALDTFGYRVAAINWASGSTGNAPLTFQGSNDNASFFNLFDDAGSEVQIASGSFSTADARSICIGPTLAVQLGSQRYLKFRRGVASAPSSVGATALGIEVIMTPW